MKLRGDDFFHLTYCTNIHPGESWTEVFANVEIYLPEIKRALAPDEPFGIGLRLSDRAARELLQGDALSRFRRWLDENELYVFTMNGFPFGGFHHQVVKDEVYRPDWTTSDRVDYTIRLAQILRALLPEGAEGGISTSPVSYKRWHRLEEHAAVFAAAARNYAEVAARLAEMDRFIHIDVEPEPDCLIENTAETAEFYERWLLPKGGAYLQEKLGIPAAEAHELLLKHIQVCYDACHFAVEYEEPADALGQLTSRGIRIGKVQVSSAIKVALPPEQDERDAVLAALERFVESTYLHQVVERASDGTLSRYADLPDALENGPASDAVEWRIHFHVPIFVDTYGMLSSTRPELERCLHIVRDEKLCAHLEIETYTWDVLPPDMKTRLSTSILREYEWAMSAMSGG